MNRVTTILGVWALAVACCGCSMCCSPYDYCAATVGPDGLPTGGFLTRRNSVLGGSPDGPMDFQTAMPTPAQVSNETPTRAPEARATASPSRWDTSPRVANQPASLMTEPDKAEADDAAH